MYHPQLGRFVSRDPLRYAAPSVYMYVGDTPTNHADPSGLKKFYLGPEATVFNWNKTLFFDTHVKVKYLQAEEIPGPCECPGDILLGVFLVKDRVDHFARVHVSGRVTSQAFFDTSIGFGDEIRFYGQAKVEDKFGVMRDKTKTLVSARCMAPKWAAAISKHYDAVSAKKKAKMANAISHANAVHESLRAFEDAQQAWTTYKDLKDAFDKLKELGDKTMSGELEDILDDIGDYVD